MVSSAIIKFTFFYQAESRIELNITRLYLLCFTHLIYYYLSQKTGIQVLKYFNNRVCIPEDPDPDPDLNRVKGSIKE
jgi:hypothetical protein